MKERLNKLKDLCSTMGQTYLLNELELLEIEIEMYVTDRELKIIEEDVAIIKGNQLLTEIKKVL